MANVINKIKCSVVWVYASFRSVHMCCMKNYGRIILTHKFFSGARGENLFLILINWYLFGMNRYIGASALCWNFHNFGLY